MNEKPSQILLFFTFALALSCIAYSSSAEEIFALSAIALKPGSLSTELV